ncbi:MAG TPA: hypothetical protein VD838_04360 [Anaeromyxobacteraceae bacterium]|nr:hypothetical protein [Anaeromyxobacteraceae bacterium]
MRSASRLLAVIAALAGTGALHAVAEAVELVACAGRCDGCEDPGEGERAPCEDGCGALCACCPAPAATSSRGADVVRPRLSAVALAIAARDPISALDARAIFHPPRS